MTNQTGVTFKRLSDGSIERIYSNDPDVIARTVKEKELGIAQRRKEDALIAYQASPNFQPSESDFVKEESLLGDISDVGEAVMLSLQTYQTLAYGERYQRP